MSNSCTLSGIKYAPLAQSVEQLPLKQTVPGSSPGGRTQEKAGQMSKDICPAFSLALYGKLCYTLAHIPSMRGWRNW